VTGEGTSTRFRFPNAIRRQSPHMHLFESFIALYQATSDGKYLARCAELFDLFSAHFFRKRMDLSWVSIPPVE
jgi:mannose/cellobiose epimerase-like protein (N-acyl-D-glucosamine 2-epimerase family)